MRDEEIEKIRGRDELEATLFLIDRRNEKLVRND